ncbi:PDZ domain (Also known as DHR or GLGF) domain-containing protein [Phthorimaea operculella]|nr:PDZ domain (Also known as DHR or GLGF) domain-containing protein [Phthorimaea operculella]
MATDVVGEEFITIVPVGETQPPPAAVRDPAFVTVLTVGAATGAAEVVVRRPRGARLGLGLKFEGGSAAAEKVRRLLVQSCAEDSPAANAIAPWGKLIPGDEILAIDGVSVSELTRIDCVRRLKDSDETLTLMVRHFSSDEKTDNKDMEKTENGHINKPTEITRPTTLPPPVPPRKLGKKNSFKDKATLQTVGEQNLIDGLPTLNGKENGVNGHNGVSSMTKLSRKSSFDSHIHRQNKEIAYLKKGSPEEVRRLVRRLSDGKTMPPEAEVYIDLLSNEWERCLLLADAESDDTGSSISTVVDRLGSMASSVENSIPSTPIMQPKTIDIQKVLNCIENIDSNILRDMTSNTFLEKQIDISTEAKTEKTTTTNGYNLESINSVENTPPVKKMQQNDKNNNNVQNTAPEINKVTPPDKPETKQEKVTEKPKPMPRNIKVERSLSERKPRPIPIPETPPPAVPEPLLTPTKKNCIETWLQRSEAEMNNKTIEKLDDPPVPEALPRLIDFVPKPQFKEGAEVPMARPTAPPPPPPAETREDGSGASLDTIGELDESSDVTDSV